LKAQRSSKSLISFAWIPTISTTHSYRLLAINKEQTFETITLEESPNFDWDPQGNISIFNHKKKINDEIHDNVGNDENQHYEIENNDESNLYQHNNSSGHKHRVSLDLKTDNDYSGNRTPRASDSSKNEIMLNNQLRGIMTHRSHDDLAKKDDKKELLMSPLEILKELQEDISFVMRKRAREGYSMDVSNTKS
jgi:hypothetical protein